MESSIEALQLLSPEETSVSCTYTCQKTCSNDVGTCLLTG